MTILKTLGSATLALPALVLTACVAEPTPSSSSTAVLSSANSSVEMSSSESSSSSLAVSSSAAVSNPSVSSSSESSSSEAGPPMVACEFAANTGNGNEFIVEQFQIVNSDARQVDSWTVTLDFKQGNINGYDPKVYGDAAKTMEIGTVTREGNSLVLKVNGSVIAPMTTQQVHGFKINPAGISMIPSCELEVAVEGYDPTGAGSAGLNGPGWDAISQAELDAYFADYPCGVNYTALGNGGWPACFRTNDGQAVCYANGQVRTLKWDADKTPVNGVRHVSGMDSDWAVLVLDDGSAYQVKTDIGIREGDKIVDSGAIAVSAGFQTRACLMIDAGDKRDLLCTEEKKPWQRPALPEDFDVVQLTSSYKMNCALNRKGQAWCWGHPDAASDIITATPAQIPFDEPVVNISADQTTLCGVSYTGKPKCITDAFVPGYVPAGAAIPGSGSGQYLADGFEPNAAFLHGAYNRGVVVRTDGTGAYYEKSGETKVELGLDNIIAGGGKRDSIVVMTEDGSIYSVNGGNERKVDGFTAQNPVCPL